MNEGYLNVLTRMRNPGTRLETKAEAEKPTKAASQWIEGKVVT